jgi:hypothetical protein
MPKVKTLDDRQEELRNLLSTPMGRSQFQALRQRYQTEAGKLISVGKSIITYIIASEPRVFSSGEHPGSSPGGFMPSYQTTTMAEKPAPQEPPHSAAIRDHVLRALGRPTSFREVQVRLLWEGRYRVNVLVGPSAVDARIPHSYFLVVDDEGKVLSSEPKLAARLEGAVSALASA